MELIRKLDKRKVGNKNFTFGLFFCPECGLEVEKIVYRGKEAKTCGCNSKRWIKTDKNSSYSRLYKIWSGIKQRCNNPKNSIYQYYGGRGIRICELWEKSYGNFKAWAESNGYNDGLEIDRIDSYGNYCPENCRFITHLENCHNRTTTILDWDKADMIRELSKTGKFTNRQIAKVFGVKDNHICNVIKNNNWKDKNDK